MEKNRNKKIDASINRTASNKNIINRNGIYQNTYFINYNKNNNKSKILSLIDKENILFMNKNYLIIKHNNNFYSNDFNKLKEILISNNNFIGIDINNQIISNTSNKTLQKNLINLLNNMKGKDNMLVKKDIIKIIQLRKNDSQTFHQHQKILHSKDNSGKPVYFVVTNCKSKDNYFDKTIVNSVCPSCLFIFNKSFSIDNYYKINLYEKQKFINAFGAEIEFYITDKYDEVESKIKNKEFKIDPFLDCFFNAGKTFKEEEKYLSNYLLAKYHQSWNLYMFTLLYDKEMMESIDIMIENTGKFHHKTMKEINNSKEIIINTLKNKDNIDINKAYSQRSLFYLMKKDYRVAKYHDKIWFLNNKKWGYTNYDKKLWLEDTFLQNINDNSFKVKFLKDTIDFLDGAIKMLLDDVQYKEKQELGYFDKENHYFEIDQNNQLIERFVYDDQFTTTYVNVDLENVMFPNKKNIEKANIFLDHLTNNNSIIKDTILNAMASTLILDDKLREKMTPCLILYGPSNTGKSTLVKTFKKILNKEIIESKNLKLNNTELFNMINKKGIIFDDAKAFNHPDAILDGNVGEMLGGFINGDGREIKELYKQDMTDVKLQLMPIIVTNYKPIITTVNMKRRSIFIELNNNIDQDPIYKDILTNKDIEKDEFLEGFTYLLFEHLGKILSDKNINNYSKNEVFEKFYHMSQLEKQLSDIEKGNWSSSLKNMFYSLNITNVEELISVPMNELFEYYKSLNNSDLSISDFINEFEINGFKFARINLTINNERISSKKVLRYIDKNKQKNRINYMKNNTIVKIINNNGEIITKDLYATNKLTFQQYGLKNVRKLSSR